MAPKKSPVKKAATKKVAKPVAALKSTKKIAKQQRKVAAKNIVSEVASAPAGPAAEVRHLGKDCRELRWGGTDTRWRRRRRPALPTALAPTALF